MRAWEIVLGVLILTHLVGQGADSALVADATQVLLVPTLAGVVWNRMDMVRTTMAVRLYGCALFFSWVGDCAPRVFDGATGFSSMVISFGVAQLCFVGTFWQLRRRKLHPGVAIGYGAGFIGLFIACAPGAGEFLPLVATYAVILVVAGALSARVNSLVGVGGLVFFLSNSLIALDAFANWYSLPLQDVAVMTTYIAAQLLLAVGLMRAWRLAAESSSGLVEQV